MNYPFAPIVILLRKKKNLGWSLTKKLTKSPSQGNDLKNIWGNHWKNYQGITKLGAWSQNQALKKVFSLISKMGLKKNLKIIDIGCGQGRTLLALRKRGFVSSLGIDFTTESLKLCQRKGLQINKDVFLADARGTKFKDKEFGLVFSEGLLEHFRNPLPIMKEMARISQRYILLIQPNHYSLYGRALAIFGPWLRGNIKEYPFSKNYFIKGFADLGFSLKAVKYTSLREFFIFLFKRIG